MSAIIIDNLTKEYLVGFWPKRRVRALDGLSLDVRPGEIFGFLGPNGAGKTTTLKLLVRALLPTSGTAYILGRSIDDFSVRQWIGFVPEHPSFSDLLTPREVLDYFGRLFGLAQYERRRRADALLNLVGLEPGVADRPVGKLSRGMLQRLNLAQALINDPRVLLLDEPMTGLDPPGRRHVRDLLSQLREQGKTVFFSTHILSDVEALCDRIAILKRGRLVECGTVAELTGSQRGQMMEMVIQGTLSDVARQKIEQWGGAFFQTPVGVRLHIPAERLFDAVDVVRQCGGRLVSVVPVRSTLEDLFIDEEESSSVDRRERGTSGKAVRGEDRPH